MTRALDDLGLDDLGLNDLGLDELARLLIVPLAFEESDDAEVDEAPDADADRRRPGSGFVVGHRDQVHRDRRDDGARAECHEGTDVHRLLEHGELPDEQGTDDECGLGDGAKEGCFPHP